MFKNILQSLQLNIALILILFVIAPIYMIVAKLVSIGILNIRVYLKDKTSYIYKTFGELSWLLPLGVI